jgi:hypothetical protein
MTILSYKLGPGTLTLGTGPLDASAQVTAIRVVPEESVETAEAVDVLSGEQLAEEETASYKYKLTATFLQDTLAAAGLVAYTWDNAGASVPFKFAPNTPLDRQITGTLRVVPLEIGGDVKKRNTSDWSVSIIGTPVLGDIP